jgi:hypothetical protein
MKVKRLRKHFKLNPKIAYTFPTFNFRRDKDPSGKSGNECAQVRVEESARRLVNSYLSSVLSGAFAATGRVQISFFRS